MKDDQGMLPVHLACRNGASKGVVLTLLNAFPESIGVKDRKGRVPLALVEASASQNKEAVIVAMKRFQQEVAKGMSFRSGNTVVAPMTGGTATAPEVDYEHRTILFRLILKKDWPAATARAHTFPDEANTWIVTKGFNGNLRFLPLHKACVLNPPDSLIEALIAANIEGAKSRDQDGWLPIHCACFYGASEGVINTLLVANPKGAQSKDDEGRLPIHYACLKCSPQGVVEGLLTSFPKGAMSKDDEGRLPIHHACSKGAPEGVIDALLKASPKGAQSKDDQGRLPLHHACRKNASERAVRTLLRVYPRAAQIKDDQDKLPIHYACQNGASASVVSVLLATYPESINVKNGFGYTPLAEARSGDNPKMEPVIKVLEKFKLEQDQIKVDSEENLAYECKLADMAQRIMTLESSLSSIGSLGKDLKANMKKTKDPYALLSRFADKLASIDMGIESASVQGSLPSPSSEEKKRLGLRGLRRTQSSSPRKTL
jgi:26S proteasome non-ATPase regulatory subunit 10